MEEELVKESAKGPVKGREGGSVKRSGLFNLFSNRIVLVLILVLFVAVASFAVGFTMAQTPIVGAFPVYSGAGDVWNPSGTANSGLLIDGNTLCFPSSSGQCDKNITWVDGNFVING